MEPFRAFVGDMLPSSQRTTGFATQSFFIGIGAIVASFLPYIFTNWFGVANTVEEGVIPLSVKLAFYIGAGTFFPAVLWIVISTKEYSPEELESFDRESKDCQENKRTTIDPSPVEARVFYKNSIYWMMTGIAITFAVTYWDIAKEVYIFGVGGLVFGIIQIITGMLTSAGKTNNALVEVLNDLFKMPDTMRQLAWVQFFSWFALFSM